MKKIVIILTAAIALTFTSAAFIINAQEAKPDSETPESAEENKFEGTMTLERIHTIVSTIDEEAKRPQPGFWQFSIGEMPIVIVTDATNDRMRIMVAIKKADTLTKEELMRIAQANFDSALDARYAVAQDALWAVYIHPLRALYDKQFVSAIAQTVTTAAEYGKSYSSGALVFGGGDSAGIIQNELINRLKNKGLAI